MSLPGVITGYSSLSKWFHWIIAMVVITMLTLSFFLDDVPAQYQPSAYMIHKSLGLTVLFLVILRFIWIQYAGKPSLPTTVPVWQKFAARAVQYSLYLFLIAMPLSGWLLSVFADKIPIFFGLFRVPFPGAHPDKMLSKLMDQTHKTIAWILISLIVLHILGAMKHHFIDKDNVLRRMLPGCKERKLP